MAEASLALIMGIFVGGLVAIVLEIFVPGGVVGTLGGVLILAVLDNLFNALEVNAFLKDVLRGVIIIAAVALYALRRRGKA